MTTEAVVLPQPEITARDITPEREAVVLTGQVAWPDVLADAIWHVDAGSLTGDSNGLEDLSGNGRDAVFGAGAAAPIVLPHDGEDYIHMPYNSDITVHRVKGGDMPPFLASDEVRVTARFRPRQALANLELLYNTLLRTGSLRVNVNTATNAVAVGIYNLTYNYTGTSVAPITLGEWHDIEVVVRQADWYCVVDGVVYDPVAHNVARADVTEYADYTIGGARDWDLQRVLVTVGGVTAMDLDPSDAARSADLTTWANPGSGGGDFVIQRATSGYKAAVVDRPLLLFDYGQHATWSGSLDAPDLTVLMAVRMWPDTQGQATYFDTSAVTNGSPGRSVLYRNSGDQESCIAWYRDANGVARTRGSNGGTVLSQGSVVVGMRFDRDGDLTPFNNGASYPAPMVDPPSSFVLDALRIGNRFNGTAGMCGEFIAAAIFDRALTDDEVALASEAMLGTPRIEDRRIITVEVLEQ